MRILSVSEMLEVSGAGVGASNPTPAPSCGGKGGAKASGKGKSSGKAKGSGKNKHSGKSKSSGKSKNSGKCR